MLRLLLFVTGKQPFCARFPGILCYFELGSKTTVNQLVSQFSGFETLSEINKEDPPTQLMANSLVTVKLIATTNLRHIFSLFINIFFQFSSAKIRLFTYEYRIVSLKRWNWLGLSKDDIISEWSNKSLLYCWPKRIRPIHRNWQTMCNSSGSNLFNNLLPWKSK